MESNQCVESTSLDQPLLGEHDDFDNRRAQSAVEQNPVKYNLKINESISMESTSEAGILQIVSPPNYKLPPTYDAIEEQFETAQTELSETMRLKKPLGDISPEFTALAEKIAREKVAML